MPNPIDTIDKNYQLFLRQKELLATMLAHHAISQAEHDKSLNALCEKMGYPVIPKA